MPEHVINENYFIKDFTFKQSIRIIVIYKYLDTEDNKHGSLVTIFSVWNAMVGTGLLTIPWAYANSGIILGLSKLLVIY